MDITRFAKQTSGHTGIGELMEDLGQAMASKEGIKMLGGGNPAHIPQVNRIWRKRMQQILSHGQELEDMLTNYDTPRGKESFLESIANLINRKYKTKLTSKNIAITNGSQTSFFLLFNLLAGRTVSGSMKRILFPLSPEYIGYADQMIDEGALVSIPALIEEQGKHFFKYHVDFDKLNITGDISAICVSRPTNPTGNVLTDDEIRHLSNLTAKHNIPLIVDNAYGAPFPDILFKPVQPLWDDHIIMGMSLSKLGLPSVRTGIIIANEDIINAVASSNAVISLSNGSLGQVMLKPMIDSEEILSISREIIRPYYQERSKLAMASIQEAFGDDFPYRIHVSEGAIFLWLWLPGLPISSKQLYQRLKAKGVLIVSGHYFFYGLESPWKHTDECLRLSYAQDSQQFREAMFILAEEIKSL